MHRLFDQCLVISHFHSSSMDHSSSTQACHLEGVWILQPVGWSTHVAFAPTVSLGKYIFGWIGVGSVDSNIGPIGSMAVNGHRRVGGWVNAFQSIIGGGRQVRNVTDQARRKGCARVGKGHEPNNHGSVVVESTIVWIHQWLVVVVVVVVVGSCISSGRHGTPFHVCHYFWTIHIVGNDGKELLFVIVPFHRGNSTLLCRRSQSPTKSHHKATCQE